MTTSLSDQERQFRDGISQRQRGLRALDPTKVAVDQRTLADHLRFVHRLATKLKYFDHTDQPQGSWAGLVPSALEPEELAKIIDAYAEDLERRLPDPPSWLGRPHFALLATFLLLLRHGQRHLNTFAERHLDFFLSEVLRMRPRTVQADEVAVILELARGVREVELEAATEIRAQGPAGEERLYRTQHPILVGRTEVASVRTLAVDVETIGFDELYQTANSAGELILDMLGLVLGEPEPGDAIPDFRLVRGGEVVWRRPVDLELLRDIKQQADFPDQKVFLRPFEFRRLMKLIAYRDQRREDEAVNEVLRASQLTYRVTTGNLQRFNAELVAELGINFAEDSIEDVESLDDVYIHRDRPEVRQIIEQRLPAPLRDNFVEVMSNKRRIEAEWGQVNQLLKRAYRVKNEARAAEYDPIFIADFEGNLEQAVGELSYEGLGDTPEPITDLRTLYQQLLRIEEHFYLRFEEVAFIAGLAARSTKFGRADFNRVKRLLLKAHRERSEGRSREQFVRMTDRARSKDRLSALIREALDVPQDALEVLVDEAGRVLTQAGASDEASRLLELSQRAQAGQELSSTEWEDVAESLAFAQRARVSEDQAGPRKLRWLNLHGWLDARSVQSQTGVGGSAWKTFGRVPSQTRDVVPVTDIGWAFSSPLLLLTEGTRTITLTLSLENLRLHSRVKGRANLTDAKAATQLESAIQAEWDVDISTLDGWHAFGQSRVVPRVDLSDPKREKVTLTITMPSDAPAIEAPSPDMFPGGTDWPVLRIRLSQRWDEELRPPRFRRAYFDYRRVRLLAIQAEVEALGLSSTLTAESDRGPVDPSKPFLPFGAEATTGNRLRIGHRELAAKRLTRMAFHLPWVAGPPSMKQHYRNYPSPKSLYAVAVNIIDARTPSSLKSRSVPEPEGANPIFQARGTSDYDASAPTVVAIEDIDLSHGRNLRPPEGRLQNWARYYELALQGDFRHRDYPAAAATQARALAVFAARPDSRIEDPATEFAIVPPYTPELEKLSIDYRASLEVNSLRGLSRPERIFHVHPFGTSDAVTTGDHAYLFPRYEDQGELYIGVKALDPPQRVSFYFEMADGSGDPDAPPVEVTWSVLDGQGWKALPEGAIERDTTRGLRASGILEVTLPEVEASDLLPRRSSPKVAEPDLYWLRATIERFARGVCDSIDIWPNAVVATADPSTMAETAGRLTPDSVKGLRRALTGITKVHQPSPSAGGRPAESPADMRVRAAERLRHRGRAVTAWDYERLVLDRFPQIFKARCISAAELHDDEPPGSLRVVVIPDVQGLESLDPFRPRAPVHLLLEIEEYLKSISPPWAQIEVRNARYVPVRVHAALKFRPGADARRSIEDLQDRVNRFLSPWAYPEGGEVIFGGTIYASSLVDLLERHDAVEYVARASLVRDPEGPVPDQVFGRGVGRYVRCHDPDEVLVGGLRHAFVIAADVGEVEEDFVGINYMQIEVDFQVG